MEAVHVSDVDPVTPRPCRAPELWRVPCDTLLCRWGSSPRTRCKTARSSTMRYRAARARGQPPGHERARADPVRKPRAANQLGRYASAEDELPGAAAACPPSHYRVQRNEARGYRQRGRRREACGAAWAHRVKPQVAGCWLRLGGGLCGVHAADPSGVFAFFRCRFRRSRADEGVRVVPSASTGRRARTSASPRHRYASRVPCASRAFITADSSAATA